MQFCWKMLPSWEQGWLNTPLSVLAEERGAAGGSPAGAGGSAAPRSILPFCIKPKDFSHLLSILLFVHRAVLIIQCRLSSPCPMCQPLRRC